MRRIGTDIGGTFTDFVEIDDASGAIRLEKTLTTPADPSQGIFGGIDLLARHATASLAQCATLVHGTTLVINALIERKGVVTALLATRGFRDVLEMRNELRYDVYDLQIEYPKPLVPRSLRLEVGERVSAEGEVLERPQREELAGLVARMRMQGVRSVAVCFLNAYANPENERSVGRMLRELAPELSVSLSSDVLPKIKEYERTSTTVASAYVKPVVDAYLGRIRQGLAERGFGGEFYVMQSGGGVLADDVAREFPIRILESGPAAGVAAARWWAARVGERDLLAFDMGGTTAKLCTIARGDVLISDEYEAARLGSFKRGSGIAINVPVFDLLEIGTGGGSIARVDALGLLKVGPRSAGASPGPACYGLGGVEPTVTDADVALGYLDPAYFLGGAMQLDAARARAAIAERIAARLEGTDALEAAWGIHDLANEAMASAARLHLAERGEDPSRMAMVAYGGAGPVHAYGLARKLGLRRLIVPPAAGVMSALGMLVEDLAIDRVRTHRGPLDATDPARLEAIYDSMRDEAAALLDTSPESLRVERIADMRYRGQGYDVRVPLGTGATSPGAMRGRFEDEYRQRYGRVYEDVAIELVNLRLIARRPAARAFEPARVAAASGGVEGALKGIRRAWFGRAGRHLDVPVFDRYRLRAGHAHTGAALVEERETTTLVGPGGGFEVNEYGMVVVHVE
jgi:N-methylhydantoinase A/oxoprolinase/acetone carboxylase beta subunit